MGAARRVSEPLQVERLDNGDRMLLRDLVIDLDVDLRLGDGTFEGFSRSADGTTVVTVPKGFTTDFSSIPAFARALYRFDSVDLAGCCHDYAYSIGVPRSPADEIWRLVAISGTRHVSEFRGRLGWIALRLGGCLSYRSHAQRRRAREAGSGAPPPG
jgi:hypothetical protein